MEEITTTDGLKDAILILEARQRIQGRELKEQFNTTLGMVGPVVKRLFIINKIVKTSVGLATGYLTKRKNIKASSFIIKNLLGSALQFGLASLLVSSTKPITSIGRILLHFVFSGKSNHIQKTNPESQLSSSN